MFFFIANYIPSQVFRGFEQLSSSVWRRVIAWGEMPPEWVLREQNFGQYLVLSHNFCSRYARKSIKGSMHVDFDLVFN